MFQARAQRRLIKAPPVHILFIRIPTSLIFLLFLLFAENWLLVFLLKKLCCVSVISWDVAARASLSLERSEREQLLSDKEDCGEAESGRWSIGSAHTRFTSTARNTPFSVLVVTLRTCLQADRFGLQSGIWMDEVISAHPPVSPVRVLPIHWPCTKLLLIILPNYAYCCIKAFKCRKWNKAESINFAMLSLHLAV